MMATFRVFVLGLAAILWAGCAGYQLGTTAPLPYRSVAVPMLKNQTYRPQLEAPITNAIIKRFQTDGTLRVETADSADVLVTGEILKITRRPLRTLRLETNIPREYQITVEIRIQARRRTTGEVVLAPVQIEGRADTFVGSDLQTAEDQAVPILAEDLAKRVVTLLAERW